MKNKLERFLIAQDNNLGCGYNHALEEIRAGKKQGHWIWYVFPLLHRLATSRVGIYYGIINREEAVNYLNHPILGARLREITNELLLKSELLPNEIFGERDALKVKSCMSLFDDISPNDIFQHVLDTFYNGERCSHTLELLNTDKNPMLDGPFVYKDQNSIDRVVEENFLDKQFDILLDKDDYYNLRDNARYMKAIALSANFFSDSLISDLVRALCEFEKKNILGTLLYIVNSGKDDISLVSVPMDRFQKFYNMLREQIAAKKFGIVKNFQTKYGPETKITITIIVGYY